MFCLVFFIGENYVIYEDNEKSFQTDIMKILKNKIKVFFYSQTMIITKFNGRD